MFAAEKKMKTKKFRNTHFTSLEILFWIQLNLWRKKKCFFSFFFFCLNFVCLNKKLDWQLVKKCLGFKWKCWHKVRCKSFKLRRKKDIFFLLFISYQYQSYADMYKKKKKITLFTSCLQYGHMVVTLCVVLRCVTPFF